MLDRPRDGWEALFPSERVDGVAFGLEEIAAFSRACHELFPALTAAGAPRFARAFQVSEPVASIFLRRSLVPLVHLFLERLVRLGRLAERAPRAAVAGTSDLEALSDIQEVERLGAQSEAFNQAVLRRLAPILGLELSGEEPPPFPRAQARTGEVFVNYNFEPFGPGERLRRAVAKRAEPLARLFPRGRQAAVAMYLGYDTAPIESRGFFLRREFVRVKLPPRELDRASPRGDLRREVLGGAVADAAGVLSRFLEAFGISDWAVRRRAEEGLADFLALMTPASLFEEAPGRLERYARLLRPHRERPLFLEEIGALGSTYLIAGARVLGMKVVSCQHGGGYGYFDVSGSPLELELPLCDAMITWGWRRWKGVLGGREPRLVPLPGPWLSERARMWRRQLKKRGRPAHDLLLMSDKIIPFPRPGCGLDALRSDQIREQAALLKSLIREAAGRGLKILHKPSDPRSAGLLQGVNEELSRLGAKLYHRTEGAGKGLSPRLVLQARMTVWDKPGSGFLECATAGLPTMVLWPRFSSREVPDAESAFRELEARGIVHRTAESLMLEFTRFRGDPEAWMKDPGRRRALARFLRTYAWTRDDWAARWRRFLRRDGAGRRFAAVAQDS